MSRMAAPMIRPRPMRKVILRKGSPGCSQPMLTNRGISSVPVRPATSAGTPMRAPTSKPAPRVEVDSSMAPRKASLAEPMPPTRPRPMPVPRRETERLQQHRVGQRAQDVGHRQARGKGQLQPVHQDGRVEHAHAGAEHADGAHEQHQLPQRRLRQAHPHHGLDQHAHAGHAGDRGRRRLHVVGAVFALGPVAGSRWTPGCRPAPARRRRSRSRSSCTRPSPRPAARG
jgi:hypothetical protein